MWTNHMQPFPGFHAFHVYIAKKLRINHASATPPPKTYARDWLKFHRSSCLHCRREASLVQNIPLLQLHPHPQAFLSLIDRQRFLRFPQVADETPHIVLARCCQAASCEKMQKVAVGVGCICK